MPDGNGSALKKRGRSQASSGPGIADLTDDLIEAYRQRRITQAEIADQLGVGRAVVRKALKARGAVQDKRKKFKDRRRSSAGDSPAAGAADRSAEKPTDGPTPEYTEALLAENDAAFLDLLSHSTEELEEQGRYLKDYVKTLHAAWRQLQGYTLDLFLAEQQGRMPKMSPKALGQIARILEKLGPNPVDHWATVIAPQQDAMAQSQSLETLRVEVMSPDDVAELRRQQEVAEAS